MIARVDQTKFGTEGDCVRASVATILGLSLEEVPDFPKTDGGAMWTAVDEFLDGRHIDRLLMTANYEPEATYLASGTTSRGLSHMVVMRDGRLLHDPHPSREGLSRVHFVHLLVPKWATEASNADSASQ